MLVSTDALSHKADAVMSITATQKAIAEVKRLADKRKAEGKAPPQGLRIGIRGGGCTGFAYLFEWADNAPSNIDKVFEFEDGVRLFVDPKSFVFLDGTELDFVTNIMGYGFKFNNPNSKGACGCGESVQF
jgi:iron-sulfur cluster assembly protein